MEWSKLNTECVDIIESTQTEWDEIINKDFVEEKYQKFLEDHSAMCWGKDIYFSISKLQLAGSFIPDFVLV